MGSSGVVAGLSSSGFINSICLLPLVVIGILAVLLLLDDLLGWFQKLINWLLDYWTCKHCGNENQVLDHCFYCRKSRHVFGKK